MRKCNKCGIQEDNIEFATKGCLCIPCHRIKAIEANKRWMAKHRDTIMQRRRDKYPEKKKEREARKQILLDMRGGRCSICGYDKCSAALDFHHIDPTQKEFRLSKNVLINDTVIAEVNKCVILCANCHREYHAGLIIL